MENPSTSTRSKGKSKADGYEELIQKLNQLGLKAPKKQHYSGTPKSVRTLIFKLVEELEKARREGAGVGLTEEEIQYIIYRLRTIYGDPMATGIVAKLSDMLRKKAPT